MTAIGRVILRCTTKAPAERDHSGKHADLDQQRPLRRFIGPLGLFLGEAHRRVRNGRH
jgi:hypothetical protein